MSKFRYAVLCVLLLASSGSFTQSSSQHAAPLISDSQSPQLGSQSLKSVHHPAANTDELIRKPYPEVYVDLGVPSTAHPVVSFVTVHYWATKTSQPNGDASQGVVNQQATVFGEGESSMVLLTSSNQTCKVIFYIRRKTPTSQDQLQIRYSDDCYAMKKSIFVNLETTTLYQ